ncbi:hypothetical protein [Enterovibrio nigricans]|uniref:Uncharacterized protein n=1 Tax=Enterovibrio nigricans DSM 22720 TaxID=1121868 RepID=A0A1T4V639_9GAMM|nr:hypothetical protein [Enterovibrio nigricans]PKF49886.1 hypothetical protein AT251_15665 [Enterovibrio nigricans]SKA60312.1 hypothetical protein SAMN02745132_03277 [Enterovibrio nigricans DSM 22720]
MTIHQDTITDKRQHITDAELEHLKNGGRIQRDIDSAKSLADTQASMFPDSRFGRAMRVNKKVSGQSQCQDTFAPCAIKQGMVFSDEEMREHAEGKTKHRQLSAESQAEKAASDYTRNVERLNKKHGAPKQTTAIHRVWCDTAQDFIYIE